MIRPRSDAFIRRHGESSSNARRAARTARSMSSACPCATSASVSSVAGLIVANVWPEAASTHSPSISSLCGEWTKLSACCSTGNARDITGLLPPRTALGHGFHWASSLLTTEITDSSLHGEGAHWPRWRLSGHERAHRLFSTTSPSSSTRCYCGGSISGRRAAGRATPSNAPVSSTANAAPPNAWPQSPSFSQKKAASNLERCNQLWVNPGMSGPRLSRSSWCSPRLR